MRKANTNDLFNIARLVNDLDLKKELFLSQKGEEDLEEIGFNMVFFILAKATTKEAQKKIYDVLCEPFEMTPEEVGKLDIDVLVENMMNCFNFSTVINFIRRANK